MKKGFLILLLLVGCQTRESRVLSAKEKDLPRGLPRARPVEPAAEAGSPPRVARGESARRLTPSDVIFPRNEAVRAKWAEQRDQILQTQQRRLDQFHAKKEGVVGRNLPRTQLGAVNANPPVVDPR